MGGETICPRCWWQFDLRRIYNTAVCRRVCSPRISGGRLAAGSQRSLGWDRQADGSRYRLMPPMAGGVIILSLFLLRNQSVFGFLCTLTTCTTRFRPLLLLLHAMQQFISISCSPGPQQQTRRSGVWQPDGMDRWVPGSCINPAPHTAGSATNTGLFIRVKFRTVQKWHKSLVFLKSKFIGICPILTVV